MSGFEARRQPMFALLLSATILVGVGGALSRSSARIRAQEPSDPECTSCANLYNLPHLALVGSRIPVTTGAMVQCPSDTLPLHLALVLDGSLPAGGAAHASIKRSAQTLVDLQDWSGRTELAITVIEVNEPSRRLCGWMTSAAEVADCVDRLASDGGSDVAGAIQLGIEALDEGRGGRAGGGDVREAIVLLSDGVDPKGCGPVVAASAGAKERGIGVLDACLTEGCERQCMRQAATSPRYSFAAGHESIAAIADALLSLRFKRGLASLATSALTATVGSAFALVPGSSSPPADLEAERVVWRSGAAPAGGFARSVVLEARRAGFGLPYLDHVEVAARTTAGRSIRLAFVSQRVDIVDARPGAEIPDLNATTPTTNDLSASVSSATVGAVVRVTYRLALPRGDGQRLSLSSVRMRGPDQFRVRATFEGGRPGGIVESDGKGAAWGFAGRRPDAIDLAAEFEGIEAGSGGFAVVAYGQPPSAPDGLEPIAMAVSAPVVVAPADGSALPERGAGAPPASPRRNRLFLPAALSGAGPIRPTF